MVRTSQDYDTHFNQCRRRTKISLPYTFYKTGNNCLRHRRQALSETFGSSLKKSSPHENLVLNAEAHVHHDNQLPIKYGNRSTITE